MSGIAARSLRSGSLEAGVHGVGPRTMRVRTTEFSIFVRDVAAGNAGGTYGVRGRFIVGGFSDSVVIRANASSSCRAAAASEFASGRDFPADMSEGIGFWVDPTTGRTWLDVVRGFDDVEEAKAAARANGEIAYFDTLIGVEWVVDAG